MENIKLNFESVEQCLDYAAQPLPSFVTQLSKEISEHRTEFCGSESYEHAMQIAREGINLDKIQAAMTELNLGMKQQEQAYSVSGAYVDIGTYLGGEPECMVTFQESEEVKFVTIKFLFSENANVSAETFTNKVVVLASIIDRLETIGYRVRLIASCRCNSERSNPKFKFNMDVVVKDYKDNMSISQISGCVSVSFFRRIMFRIIEHIFSKFSLDANDYGYGKSTDWIDEDIDDSLLIGKSGRPHNFSNKKELKNIINSILSNYE
jgi:hypothetical protein